MKYIIYVLIFLIFLLLFSMVTRTKGIGRIIIINLICNFFCCIILLLSHLVEDKFFIDIIFFYILMSPLSAIGIFIYSKYKNAKKKEINSLM
jgi:multisubunit Na+/H+ antiporter MnhF subunit